MVAKAESQRQQEANVTKWLCCGKKKWRRTGERQTDRERERETLFKDSLRRSYATSSVGFVDRSCSITQDWNRFLFFVLERPSWPSDVKRGWANGPRAAILESHWPGGGKGSRRMITGLFTSDDDTQAATALRVNWPKDYTWVKGIACPVSCRRRKKLMVTLGSV